MTKLYEHLKDPMIVKPSEQCGTGPGAVFEPNYWDSRFLEAHGRFVWSLAKRYFNNDKETAGSDGAPDWTSRISTIEMSTYGTWGEWHSTVVWPSEDVKRTTLNVMIRHYHEAFSWWAKAKNSVPPVFEVSAVGSTTGLENNIYASNDPSQVLFGSAKAPELFGTSSSMTRKFIGADPNKFLQTDERRVLSENLPKSPLRLEWGSCTGNLTPEDFACLGGTPMTLEQAVDYALNLGASEIGWYIPEPLGVTKGGSSYSIEHYFQLKAGYRFFISEFNFPDLVERGGALKIQQAWNQRNDGKLYRKHYVGAFLSDGTGAPDKVLGVDDTLQVHTWPRGVQTNQLVTSTFVIPADLEPGWYLLKYAIVDKSGAPAMNLAISGKDITDANDYGRYSLGWIYVK